MLACLMQDLMRLIWPCSSVEDLKQMSGWCEEINNTRCLEELAHLLLNTVFIFGHPMQIMYSIIIRKGRRRGNRERIGKKYVVI